MMGVAKVYDQSLVCPRICAAVIHADPFQYWMSVPARFRPMDDDGVEQVCPEDDVSTKML